jgi:hypothetical protein
MAKALGPLAADSRKFSTEGARGADRARYLPASFLKRACRQAPRLPLEKRRLRSVAVFWAALRITEHTYALAYIGMREFVKRSRAIGGRADALTHSAGYSLSSSLSAAFPARLASVMDAK